MCCQFFWMSSRCLSFRLSSICIRRQCWWNLSDSWRLSNYTRRVELTCASESKPKSVKCSVMSEAGKVSCLRCLLKRTTARSPPASMVAHICKQYMITKSNPCIKGDWERHFACMAVKCLGWMKCQNYKSTCQQAIASCLVTFQLTGKVVTSLGPCFQMRSPAMPKGSWLSAMTSFAFKILSCSGSNNLQCCRHLSTCAGILPSTYVIHPLAWWKELMKRMYKINLLRLWWASRLPTCFRIKFDTKSLYLFGHPEGMNC